MDDTLFDVVLAGITAMAIAAVAWLADRRRMRRSDPDAVGFIPWATLYFWASFVGFLLLVLAWQMH